MHESAKPVILPDDVIGALAADTGISTVELTGSRARGQATPLSDWDFAVTTSRFEDVRDALPETVRPLHPVVAQWDRLSRIWCYMLILPGPAKVDLLFGHPHQPAGPWQVNASTLAGIDGHFWDWIMLAALEAGGVQARCRGRRTGQAARASAQPDGSHIGTGEPERGGHRVPLGPREMGNTARVIRIAERREHGDPGTAPVDP